jgi:hypothetical protein
MPPKQKQKTLSSDEEQSFDDQSEEMSDNDSGSIEQSDYEDGYEGREVNREHLLNYESDESDSDVNMDDSDDEFGQGLTQQKEELVMNDAWGIKKRNFYGRDKKQDVLISTHNMFYIGCDI